MGETENAGLLKTTVRVATWNVWGDGGDWRARYAQIAETLKAIDPDIICLQEVWRSDAFDAPAFLAAELGYHYEAILNWAEMFKLDYGSAILSRWPLCDADSLMPDKAHPAAYSLFQAATVQGPRGRLLAANAMLAWRPDHSIFRQAQAKELGSWIKEKRERGRAVVLCGDLNAGPESDEVRALRGETTATASGLVFHDAWAEAKPNHEGYTWTKANPLTHEAALWDRRIDHVFSAWGGSRGLGQPLAAGLLGDDEGGGPIASDHYGVWADLRY